MRKEETNYSVYQGKRVHFIGIGGCSMSGLAGLLQDRGYTVTGSDRMRSHVTDALLLRGIRVFIGHDAVQVRGADLVVYTAAIPKDNVEFAFAHEKGIPMLERSVLLGQIMQGHTHAIGVCGAHGKTTTTAMLSRALVESGCDPTIHIGGELEYLGGSTREGGREFFLCEADEFAASFLQLSPTVAVLLNMDEDHLDFYGTMENVIASFEKFIALLPPDGVCVGCGDDQRVRAIMQKARCRRVSYGLQEGNDWTAREIIYNETGCAGFIAVHKGEDVCHVQLSVAGSFHILNALATLATCLLFDLDKEVVSSALGAFTNAHRRFEKTAQKDGVAYYHDYAHHPTEVGNVLSVARLQKPKRVIAVHQPHTYSRTKNLFTEFSQAFDQADVVLVTDIYAAREIDPGDIHATQVVSSIIGNGKTCYYTPTFEDARDCLRRIVQEGDLVITLGCGNINMLNDLLP